MKHVIYFLIMLPAILTAFNIAYAKPVQLNVEQSTLTLDNQPVKVYKIVQNNGKEGYVGTIGTNFDAIINNKTQVPITLHWHGLIDNYKYDGVPYVTQLPLAPGSKEHVLFPLVQKGTYWMHSHKGLQEAQLMAAPLIINPAQKEHTDVKSITVMLEDITKASPETVLYKLQHPKAMKKMDSDKSAPDLYDVKSDALLANRKTLNEPEVFNVKAGEKVVLRLINADSANNIYVHLPKNMMATVIAKDGENTKPYYNVNFQLGVANTLDILMTIPDQKNAVYPIFFQAEGRKLRTGIVLKTGNEKVPHYSNYAKTADPGFNYGQEYNIHPEKPLPKRKIDRTLTYELTGNMAQYKWAINNQYWPKVTPEFVKKGERVKIIIHNRTGMSHPMHFHGHVFQLVAINGNKLDGFKGNTVTVLPHSTVTLIFDANNPGIWAFHCHLLYHLASGMMTTINYVGVTPPDFYLKKIGLTMKQYAKLRHTQIEKLTE